MQRSWTDRSSIWCLFVLLPLTGCSWILGIFYVNEDTDWIQYLFVICNTLQGCAIFLFHCVFNKQMIEAVRLRRRKRNGSTLNTEQPSCLCIRVRSKPSSKSNTTSELSKTKV